VTSSKQYQLEKSIWTEEDFESMAWHDSRIYAVSFSAEFQLIFDIDYIFKWVLTGKTYKFWIAPCTLVFENVYDIRFDLSTPEIDIDDIERNNPQRPKNADYIKREIEFDRIIETRQGSISFKSIGYKQYVRQLPKLIHGQYFGIESRGGVSFEPNPVKL
jgi:hypothetical protein